MLKLDEFKHVWLTDFEFRDSPLKTPHVICMVARDLVTGRTIRKWLDTDKNICEYNNFFADQSSLFVAYYAMAELGCFHSLGWNLPVNLVDLFVEFRNYTNGSQNRKGLIDALEYFDLEAPSVINKQSMRDLILSNNKYTIREQQDILDYCQSDVEPLAPLFKKLISDKNLNHALLRGKELIALSDIEKRGVPIDTYTLDRLNKHWDKIKIKLVEEANPIYGVFEGISFKTKKFEKYLSDKGYSWPRLSTGNLDMKEDTFKEMSLIYPELKLLRDIRNTLSKMRLNDLIVGEDGFNRVMLSPFQSSTGRSQPSNSKFIFGFSSWLRHLIKPKEGYGIAYIDWSQQEFGIAAALSGDENMKRAYHSGDPYMTFAIQSGAAPKGATKESHPDIRALFKECILATQYGMGKHSLARRIRKSSSKAEELLLQHRNVYEDFWKWSDKVADFAYAKNQITTTLGWNLNVYKHTKEKTVRNFPMQANGAEMLRLACIYLIETKIEVCATVHDAILIQAPINELTAKIKEAQNLMALASRDLLGGFELNSEAEIYEYPEHYSDPKGKELWEKIMSYMDEFDLCTNEHLSVTQENRNL